MNNDIDIELEKIETVENAPETEPEELKTQDTAETSEPEKENSGISFIEYLKSLNESESDTVTEDNAPEPDQEPEPDYESELIRMKAEYKLMKRARRLSQEEKRENGENAKARPVLTIVISVLASLICFVMLFALFFLFPTRDTSIFASMARKYIRDYGLRSDNTLSDSTSINGTEIPAGSNVTINIDGEFSASAAYAKASPSVVSIVTAGVGTGADGTKTETTIAQGAGVVISEDGEILTNFHVISSVVDTKTGSLAKNTKIYIYFDNPLSRPYLVTSVIGYDSEFDLALIKIDRTGLTPIEFSDSDELIVGESVIAIGSPGGLDFMGSVCDGIVSGVKRTVVSSESGATLYDMIQMTAPINPGNSGGAVVNSSGQLVGISVIKIVAENYENMAFAISSNTASRLIQSFRKYGKYVKPLLGVTINTLYGWADADENGWPLGSLVAGISEGSGADKAGIIEGDIICAINDKDTPDYTSLRTYLLKYAPGDEVTFKVYRPKDNKYYEIKVTLTAA